MQDTLIPLAENAIFCQLRTPHTPIELNEAEKFAIAVLSGVDFSTTMKCKGDSYICEMKTAKTGIVWDGERFFVVVPGDSCK